MQSFLYALFEYISLINETVGGLILVLALGGTGIFFTLKTRFVQVRCFRQGLCSLFGKSKSGHGITPFQALCTSLASQLGTGNIVGACSAVVVGGAGSVFWMWVFAFFGMASAYAEGVLAVKTRKRNKDGSFSGGPVYIIKQAFGKKTGKVLSLFFAFFGVVLFGFAGNMVQANAVSKTFYDALCIDTRITGFILLSLSCAVMLLGADGIVKFAEKTVPVMSLLFVFGCAALLFVYRSYIPECVELVMKSAFSPQPVLGAVTGYSVRNALFYGAKRGLFSNEAGMGTSSHAYALVKEDVSPHSQGTSAMMCVFFDTMLMMTLTAFSVITVSLCAENGDISMFSSTNMTLFAFGKVFGENAGNALVSVCLLFFGFTSIVGWSMYGRMNFEYLFGHKYKTLYYVFVLVFVYIGCISTNSFVWNLADLFSVMLVLPNVLSLVALHKTVAYESRRLDKRHKNMYN